MTKGKIILAVLCLIALSVQANAEQVQISPKYILLNEYNPDYSNSPLEIYVGTFQSGTSNYRTRSLLYFDISEVKGPVSEAALELDVRLRHEPHTKEEAYEIGVYRVLQRWEKPSWNTPLAFESSPSARISVAGDGIYRIAGMRDLVSSWAANPETNNQGIILKGTNEWTANIKEMESAILTVTYEETSSCSAIGGACKSSCGSGEAESPSYSCGILVYRECCVEAPPTAPPAPQPPEQIPVSGAQPEIPASAPAQETVSEPDEPASAGQPQPAEEPAGTAAAQRQTGTARGPEAVRCPLYDYNKNGRLDGGDSGIFNSVVADNTISAGYVMDDGRRMVFDIDGDGRISSGDYALLLENPECIAGEGSGEIGAGTLEAGIPAGEAEDAPQTDGEQMPQAEEGGIGEYCSDGTSANNCNSGGLYCGNENLLSNSGFEALNDESFPVYYIENGAARVDMEHAYKGGNSARLSGRWASLDLNKRLVLDASADYVFRAKVKGGCTDYRLFGNFRDTTYSMCTIGSCKLAGSGEWRDFEAVFNSGNFDNEIIERLRLECADPVVPGELYPVSWVDVMSLEREKSNLVANPGFEKASYGQSDLPAGWNKNNPGQPESVFSVAWSPFGLYSAKIEAEGNSNWYGIISDPIKVDALAKYKLTGFAFVDNADDFTVTIHVKPLEGAEHSFYCIRNQCTDWNSIIAGEHNYKKYEKEFTTESRDDLYAYVIAAFRPGRSGTAVVDGISLEKIDDGPELHDNNCGVCGCGEGEKCAISGACEPVPAPEELLEPRIGIFPITYFNFGQFYVERPKISIYEQPEAGDCASDVSEPSRRITIWGRTTGNNYLRIHINPSDSNQGVFSNWEFCSLSSDNREIPAGYSYVQTANIDGDAEGERVAVEESDGGGWTIAVYDSIAQSELESKRLLYEGQKSAVKIIADDIYDLYLNGNLVGSGRWDDINKHNINLREGENIIGIRARDTGGKEGLIAEVYHDGKLMAKSDSSWKAKLFQDMSEYESSNWNRIGGAFDDSSWETPEEQHKRDNLDARSRGFVFGKWIWGETTRTSGLSGENEGYAFRKVITVDASPDYGAGSTTGADDTDAAARLAAFVKQNDLEGINTLPPAYKAAGMRKYSEYNCDIGHCPSGTCVQNALEFCCAGYADKDERYRCKAGIVEASGLEYAPDSAGKLYTDRDPAAARQVTPLRTDENPGGWLEYKEFTGRSVLTYRFEFTQPIWHKGTFMEFIDDGVWTDIQAERRREEERKIFQNTLPYDVLHAPNRRLYLCNEKGIFVADNPGSELNEYYFCSGDSWYDLKIGANAVTGCPDALCVRETLARLCADEPCRQELIGESGLLFEPEIKYSVCRREGGEVAPVGLSDTGTGSNPCGGGEVTRLWHGRAVYVPGDGGQNDYYALPDGGKIWHGGDSLGQIANQFGFDLLLSRNRNLGEHWRECGKIGIFMDDSGSYFCDGSDWEVI
ncbi:DNRLRE domain-containing protein [Candidatus Woesearchaeota archaeon]|nr:DNRLRE domain-containing protein [Candidatus Woesearchaeota archaeon]